MLYSRTSHPVPINRRLVSVLLAGVTALPLITATTAYGAEAAAENDSAIEEIMVTARRRSENLQDVPISVSAFSGDQLAKAGVQDITELTQSVPNITFEVSRGSNSTLTLFIRGVGQQDPVAGFESGVGLYIDDVYLNRPQGTVFDVYDVERIEVLRGPQGTLYGRNTIGGAVKYVTRRLSDEPEAKITLSGGSYKQSDFVGTVSLPISQTLRVGGTLAYFRRDGFGKNLTTGAEHYNKQVLAGRLSVEWTPADNVFIRLAGDLSDDDSNARAGHRLTVGNLTGAPILKNVFDTRAGITQNPSSAGINGQQQVHQGGVSLTGEWEVDDRFTLKSITAYREDNSVSPIDFDSLPGNDFDVPVIYNNWQFSQELQMLYEGDRLHGILGFYYMRANAADNFDVVLGNLFGGLTASTLGNVDTKTWSVFGDFTYDLLETVSLSLGGRYTSDERTAVVLRQTFLGIGSPAMGNTSAVLLATTGDFTGNDTFKKFTPRASLSWRPVEEHNLYVTYSKGFKGGGFDPRGSNLAVQGFQPETVDSIEGGAKSRWFDGRATTNLAVFYSDYNNQQIPGSVGVDTDGDGVNDNFVGTVTNAGSSKIWGLEFEGNALITDSLSVNASAGYINADFKKFIVNGVNVQATKVFQNTPKWNGHLAVTYERPARLFKDDGSIALTGAVSYKSKTHQFEDPNPFLDQNKYALLDASIVWTSEDGRIQAGLYGKNLTDKKYKTSGYFFPTLGLEGVVSAFYGNPMTITGTLAYRF